MPRPRAAMRKIREALRLCLAEGLSPRQTGIATGLPRTTVRRYVERAAEVGLGWPLPPELDDRALEERLFDRPAPPATDQRPIPDWPAVHRELRRKSVTLALLWSEYRTACPDGFGYTWFTEHYRAWAGRLDVVLRQDHRAGEKLFLDFAGQTIPITDPLTGEITQAQLFVAVLGASNYTYAEALPSQAECWWTAAHVRAFAFMGGAPAILVPDNLKAGVIKPHRYEPILNASYAELAAHYGCAILPARPKKPRDKANVESGVLVAERWIAAALRNRTFYSIAEANRAIAERVTWLNDRPLQEARGIPGEPVRRARSTGPAAAARDPLRVRRLEAREGQHRLPRRGRAPLLQRAVHARGRAGRRPGIGAHGRGLRPGPACGEPPAEQCRGPAHDRDGAHARVPSPASRVDARAPGRLGRADRTRHRSPGGGDPAQPAAPRAGLPIVPRDLPPRAPPRGGTP